MANKVTKYERGDKEITDKVHSAVNKLFNDTFGRELTGPGAIARKKQTPAVDISERSKHDGMIVCLLVTLYKLR